MSKNCVKLHSSAMWKWGGGGGGGGSKQNSDGLAQSGRGS